MEAYRKAMPATRAAPEPLLVTTVTYQGCSCRLAMRSAQEAEVCADAEIHRLCREGVA